MAKSVYIVDDNNEFRESTAWLLEGVGYCVESYADASKAFSELSNKNIEDNEGACILMDVRMPEMSGLDLHDQLNGKGVDIPVIYMTGHASVAVAVEAMKKGAITYLEKPLDSQMLQAALDSAFSEQCNLKKKNVSKNLENEGVDKKDNEIDKAKAVYQERYSSLTPREIEVLCGIVDGKMNKVIAYDLGISVKTIEIHRSQVKKKMQAKSAADLVKMVLTEKAV